jgi:hypothetical protein
VSTSIQPAPPSPPANGVSLATLCLSVALAVCATAAIILAVVHFRPTAPAAATGRGADSGRAEARAAPSADEPLVQKDAVSPQGRLSDIVYYPTPYASPPNLKLTVTASKRVYDIVKQDETGFTWKARLTVNDIQVGKVKEAEDKLVTFGGNFETLLTVLTPGGWLKPDLQLEDFTWEAKGVRAGKDAGLRVFEQTGTFNSIHGKDGPVNFPSPYAVPPNVELTQPKSAVIVTECQPTGFKWKNAGDDWREDATVTWKAKGIRAAEIPKVKPE